MADHVRTQCRDAAVALLANLTVGSDTVSAEGGRPESRPLMEANLPAILVYTNEEEAEYTSGTRGSRRLERRCQLMVHGFAQDTNDLDKTLDAIAKVVEAALEAAPTLGGLAKDVYLTGTTKSVDPEAKQPTGEVVLNFTVEYHTREGAPDAAFA